MTNAIVEGYVDGLKEKFPSCSLTQAKVGDEIIVSVKWERGEEWFEMPVLFSSNISVEQFNAGRTDLDEWEEEISTRLRNDGCLPTK